MLLEHAAADYFASRRLQQFEFDLTLLFELTEALARAPSMRQIGSVTAGKIKVLTGCRSAYFFRATAPGTFTCTGHWQHGDRLGIRLPDLPPGALRSIEAFTSAALGHVRTSSAPLSDAQLCVPVVTEGPVSSPLMAFIVLGPRWSGPFGGRELHLLTMVARQTAPFVDIMDRYDQVVELKGAFQTELSGPHPAKGLVASSDNMRNVVALVERLSAQETASTVLIRGETGTGKELIARLIHAGSRRAAGPFIAVNCGALPRELVESELFGHEKGAFTDARTTRKGKFELADGGTLFLDEIGDLPLEAQVKLLRVLQDKSFERLGGSRSLHTDVRVVAATHVHLETLMEQKRFRDDLYYRLNVFPIHLPPLRERRADIEPLIAHLIAKHARKPSVDLRSWLTAEALELMLRYPWPGNIRELENLIERMLILGRFPIEAHALPPEFHGRPPSVATNKEEVTSLGEELRVLKASVAELQNRLSGGTDSSSAGPFTSREEQLLRTLRSQHFRFDEAAREHGLTPGRMRELFKGLCFKVYVKSEFDLAGTARLLGGEAGLGTKVEAKVREYLDHVKKTFGGRRSRGKSYRVHASKLPLEYRGYLDEILAHFDRSDSRN